ncbi:hypothetical protein [Actinomycetospora cinnamomea]|uniref:Uncharacterized protein n=1 Tax=Actinomycetospora cinnamomea TaxID=663609 RepID=A0A2U1E9Y4_9PSEU|nr:hypothetical protein [Actinomycetospora cinnamomea]PVY96695.1 hypothetical protein C8D89_1284 [Actinomycetospora cinnamomea]
MPDPSPRHPVTGRPTNRVTDAHESAVESHRHEQLMAARVIASRSTGVEDCAELLGMLGLAQAVGLPVVESPPRV